MAKLSENQLDGWQQNEKESFGDYLDRQDIMLDSLMIKSRNSKTMLEKVISFPIADGKAWYIVSQENPLEVSLIPYGDCYQVNPIMIKGLDEEDINDITERDNLLNKLFNSKVK